MVSLSRTPFGDGRPRLTDIWTRHCGSNSQRTPKSGLVDAGIATALAATLLVWDLESAGERRLVGAVEFQFTGADRTVHTQVVRASEPVSTELPGNLATAAGTLLRRLVSEGVTHIVGELKQDLRRGETPQ